jgi:hypothetical protein
MAKHYKIRVNSLSLKNELPAKIEPGFSIYNLDSADKLGNATGTHWTGSFCDAKRCCYFDSFGAPCPNEIDRFIKARYMTYGINNWIIQDPKSENCGFFVLAFAIWMTHLYKAKFTQVQMILSICLLRIQKRTIGFLNPFLHDLETYTQS